MNFTVEQECPQCGGTIELDDADHLLSCPFCRVKHFLYTHDYTRLYLPPTSLHENLIYAPYMRFKGMAYSCEGTSVNHRVVDLTLQGTPMKQLPFSLGFRPQALKMRFVSSDMEGSFLYNAITSDDVLTALEKRRSIAGSGEVFHRTYIGEVVTCIYLPLIIEKDQLYDAVVNKPIAKVAGCDDILASSIDTEPSWKITYIPTICPNCGWDLEGGKDSVVLTCSSCNTGWQTSKAKFIQVDFEVVPDTDGKTVFVPFWRFTVEDETLNIRSFADYIRVLGRPMLVPEGRENGGMSFWIPAVKIRPGVFLRLAEQITFFQNDFQVEKAELPENLYPVTLPRSEAVQALKVILANSVLNKKDVFPLLPRVNFTLQKTTLVYLPFDDTGHELIQKQKRLSVHKNTLKAGRNL